MVQTSLVGRDYHQSFAQPDFGAEKGKGLSGDFLPIFLCLRPKMAPEKSARNPGYQWYARKSGKSPAQFGRLSSTKHGRTNLLENPVFLAQEPRHPAKSSMLGAPHTKYPGNFSFCKCPQTQTLHNKSLKFQFFGRMKHRCNGNSSIQRCLNAAIRKISKHVQCVHKTASFWKCWCDWRHGQERKVSGTRAHSHSHRHEASESERERGREREREREWDGESESQSERDRERERENFKRKRERHGSEAPTAGIPNKNENKPYAKIFSGSYFPNFTKITSRRIIYRKSRIWHVIPAQNYAK